MRFQLLPLACGVLTLTASLGLNACDRQPHPTPAPAPAWREVADADLTPEQIEARDAAMAAIADLQQTLLSNVSSSMKDRGPAATIAVCKDLAPQLAAQIGAQHNLRIGRTSHRLRNPKNTGPPWIAPLVSARRDEVVTMVGPGNAVRLAIPIHLATPCLGCHGNPDVLAPEVVSTLAAQYPDDAATGFAEGDLRGWFWVEPIETP